MESSAANDHGRWIVRAPDRRIEPGHCLALHAGRWLRSRAGRVHVGAGVRGLPRLPWTVNLQLIGRAGDHQCPAMVRKVAGTTQQTNIRSIVAAAVRAMDDVVELERPRGSTAGHAAASAIATPHQTRSARWDVLMGALGHGTVDRSDVLRVAQCALGRRRFDRDLHAGALLPALPATLAHRHCDLVLRPPSALGALNATECRAAQRRYEFIVGQVHRMFAVQHRPCLPEQRERVGGQFEPDDVRAGLGIRRIIGPIAGAMIGGDRSRSSVAVIGRGDCSLRSTGQPLRGCASEAPRPRGAGREPDTNMGSSAFISGGTPSADDLRRLGYARRDRSAPRPVTNALTTERVLPGARLCGGGAIDPDAAAFGARACADGRRAAQPAKGGGTARWAGSAAPDCGRAAV
jgi:hypothetical protein